MTGIVRTGIGVQVGTSGTATDNFSIYQPDTPDGTVRIANGSPETPTDVAQFDSSGNFKFNSGYGSVATAYACRAWVNFNGTGTVAIRASGNVTGITDNGTGKYTVNFTTAMPDANYSVSGSVAWSSASTWGNTFMLSSNNFSSSSFEFASQDNNATTSAFVVNDATIACVQVFR